MSRQAVVACFASAVTLVSACAVAEERGPRSSVDEVGVGGGVGFAHEVKGSLADGDFATLTLSWRRYIRERHALGAEAVPFFKTTGSSDAFALGFTLLGRHVLTDVTKPTRLFADWGVGMLYLDGKLPEDGTQANFVLRVGAGVEHILGRSKKLAGGYRLQHVSNAERGASNPGINASYLFVELLFVF